MTADYNLFETMGATLAPTGETFTHTVRTDGIEITHFDGRIDHIDHHEFREWSFKAGYWSGAYYEFVDSVSYRILDKFLTEKNDNHAN